MVQLGVVLLEQGRAQQALAYLDKALEMDPDHQQALLNSAVLIQASNSTLTHQLSHSPTLYLPPHPSQSQTTPATSPHSTCSLIDADLTWLTTHHLLDTKFTPLSTYLAFSQESPNHLTFYYIHGGWPRIETK